MRAGIEYNTIGLIANQMPSPLVATPLQGCHASWQTEGALELLGQHNFASVLTDSPDPGLQFLSNPVVTAEHSLIRLYGRNHGFWYNYLYSKKELESWFSKVNAIAKEVKKLRI